MKIIQKKFVEVDASDLAFLDEVYKATRPSMTEPQSDGSYLIDETDYAGLIEYSCEQQENSGRIFIAFQDAEPIGFVLCLDNVEIEPDSFPIEYYSKHVPHARNFLDDIFQIGMFGFVHQIAVLPDHQKRGVGKYLLEALEKFYRQTQAVILAAALEEGQHRIISMLSQQAKYLFLDQYFSPDNPDELRFRVVLQLKAGIFYEKINAPNLRRSFNTIIPIQLNLSMQTINRVIGKLGAKILWCSFFHDNPMLQKVNGMSKRYTAFYQTILEADYQDFQKLLPVLKKITESTQEDKNRNQASILRVLKKKGVDFFFLNDDANASDFSSFGNPLLFNIEGKEVVHQILRSDDFLRIRTPLTGEEKKEWWDLLSKLARVPPDKDFTKIPSTDDRAVWEDRLRKWNKWKLQLSISPVEERELIHRQRAINATNDRAAVEWIESFHLSRKKVTEEEYRQWVEWVDLHRTAYQADCMVLDNPEDYWWCHVMAPITFSGGVSGIMFSFRCLKSGNLKEKETLLNDLAQTIISSLSKNMFNIIIKLQKHTIDEEAYRYAVATISARNLSHNLGSHILSKLGYYSDLEEVITGSDDGFPAQVKQDFEPGLRLLANFHNYLRTRMNLIADISTSEPVASIRAAIDREVLLHVRRQELINRFISGTDLEVVHIKFENKIEGQEEQDVTVQIPNGELGISAFAMILENIIRNTAKHEYDITDQHMVVHIIVMSENDRGYHILIRDNVKREKTKTKALIKRINTDYINKKLISDDYSIRRNGWGIAEMKVAASYLRKKMPGIYAGTDEERRIPFLRAVPVEVPKEKRNCYLGYQIYLKKPRELLIIDSAYVLTRERKPQSWMKHGIKIQSLWEIQNNEKEVHSHQIVILMDFVGRSTHEKIKRFPFRWLLMQTPEEQQTLKQKLEEDIEQAILWVWEKWLARYQRKKYLSDLHFELFICEPKYQTKNLSRTNTKPECAIVYDVHGDALKQGILQKSGQYQFYEAFGTIDPMGKLIMSMEDFPSPEKKRRLEIGLIEAAITQVAIIDERIQWEAHKREIPFDISSENFIEYLQWMNIHVPNPIDPNAPRLFEQMPAAELESKLISWIYGIFQREKIDFLILHVGILEKFLEESEIASWIEDRITRKEPRTEVILISGRGKPQQMPSISSFQQYNNIAKHVIEDTSKYHLCQMLFSSRTRLG